MGSKSNRILNVVDFEATCWYDNYVPLGQHQEIIQIGITQYNTKERAIVNSDSWLVKPIDSEISEFCTELTGITTEQIAEEGRFYRGIMEDLMETRGIFKYPWGSWGDFDKHLLKDTRSRLEHRKYFNHSHFNLKKLVAMVRGTKSDMGLQKACRVLDLDFEGDNHDAKWDSYNAAKIVDKIFEPLSGFLCD